MSFTIINIKFIDSLAFLNATLDQLRHNLYDYDDEEVVQSNEQNG